MLLYKNYQADLKGKYEKYLKISLVFTLLLVIAAFKFSPKAIKIEKPKSMVDDPIFVEPEINTTHKNEPPSLPKPLDPVITTNEITEEIEMIDVSINETIELSKPPVITKEKIVEDEVVSFFAIEEKPKIIEGMESLQKIEYPEIVKRTGIQGQVVIEFIVNKEGEVESAKVIKSVIIQLDEICLDLIKQLKFSPGLQRGKPVKVKMSVPINFKLK